MIQLDATYTKFIQWINFVCVASSWIISLPSDMMHGHMNTKKQKCFTFA
jgi:hypothetical protein